MQVDINGVPFTYENKDELVFESDPNQREPEEESSGLLDDLKKIVSLGETLREQKIDYSFRSIFKEEKK